jgi:Flp pilus assembly pilin Flp
MNQPSTTHVQYLSANPGATTVEYAILIGLVGVVCIVGLKALGVSTYNLLSHADVENNSTLSLLTPIQQPHSATSGRIAAPGSGNAPAYTLKTDPATGEMTFQLGDTGNNVATNVTSIDGKTMNTLGSTLLADQLDQLAQAETDPALKSYYTQLAQLSYYMGGAEGVLDNIQSLTPPASQTYTNADALHDVVTLSTQLKDLMSNPPANLDQASFNEVMPLAAEVYNIANKYQTGLSDYIVQNPDGTVQVKAFDGQTKEATGLLAGLLGLFGIDLPATTTQADNTGNGQPGSALTTNKSVPGDPQTTYTSYASLVDLDSMKSKANQVISSNHVKSVSVTSTLTDATVINQTATASSTNTIVINQTVTVSSTPGTR